MEVEIGMGKSGRRAYGLDDIAIVPSRRTRDPEDIDLSWQLGPYRFELPFLGSAMDGVIDPGMAIAIGKLGGLGVLNLEGLQTRYEDPDPVLAEIASLSKEEATRGIQRLYAEPIKPELIGKRVKEIKDSGVITAASLPICFRKIGTSVTCPRKLYSVCASASGIKTVPFSASGVCKSKMPTTLKLCCRIASFLLRPSSVTLSPTPTPSRSASALPM